MKMKYILLSVLMLATVLTSCNYLDVVPEERGKIEDSYSTPGRTEGFLYSCYAYLPLLRTTNEGSKVWSNWYPLDRETAGETCAYPKEARGTFPQGTYSPTDPQLANDLWSPIWKGVRQCYEFLSILDKAVVYSESDREYYRAEATFLIGFYHYYSLQAFGPTVIVDQKYDLNMDMRLLPERSSYDAVVAFINEKIEEALPHLSDSHELTRFGRITKAAAHALKSRLYLYAASPLFNGNIWYADFKNSKGEHLIAQTYDAKKWEVSASASLKAIQVAEAQGFGLYQAADAGDPSAAKPGFTSATEAGKAQRAVRYCFMDTENLKEVILGDRRREGQYDVQIRSLPRQTSGGIPTQTNSTTPTLQMVEAFYTKNGLPIDKDNEYDYEHRYELTNLPKNYDGNNYPDRTADRTVRLHLNREPRFYAWIGFHKGNYEISAYNNVSTSTPANKYQAVLPGGLSMLFGQAQGRTNANTNVHYSVNGYLNKKFVSPSYVKGQVDYPYPVFRIAELYLNYAEALIEIGGESNFATAREYIDRIRVRAGVPRIVDALKHATPDWMGKENDQDVLRQIVRRERKIEFYLEAHLFWDLRRWKQAEVLGEPNWGWDINAAKIEDFYKAPVEMANRTSFKQAQYLMPINIVEIQKAPQIIQNPFY
ncbi:RagB/SusD family nutrient uptake outer membrane protein [Bacteroides sp.]|uniref:RagB/SusD family nutrient uptake outer membrane protein n=2 Tax=Bacteria TaxID=2 RepID=UPI002FCC01D0